MVSAHLVANVKYIFYDWIKLERNRIPSRCRLPGAVVENAAFTNVSRARNIATGSEYDVISTVDLLIQCYIRHAITRNRYKFFDKHGCFIQRFCYVSIYFNEFYAAFAPFSIKGNLLNVSWKHYGEKRVYKII